MYYVRIQKNEIVRLVAVSAENEPAFVQDCRGEEGWYRTTVKMEHVYLHVPGFDEYTEHETYILHEIGKRVSFTDPIQGKRRRAFKRINTAGREKGCVTLLYHPAGNHCLKFYGTRTAVGYTGGIVKESEDYFVLTLRRGLTLLAQFVSTGWALELARKTKADIQAISKGKTPHRLNRALAGAEYFSQ